MGLREGILFLFVLAISWRYADARNLIGDSKIPSGSKISESFGRNGQLCTLCEEFTAQATNYFGDNKTHTEIIDTLHQACSQSHSFKEQCVTLVDYYASLFFVEIAKIQPEELCRKVNLCEETVSLYLSKRNDTCTLCHDAVVKVLAKLKDPDTQFGIIEMLLKECKNMGQYVQECKRLVFQYGPLILANGEKLLETTDVCASIHACHGGDKAVVGMASVGDDRALLDA